MPGSKPINILFKRKRFDTHKRYKSCIESESYKHPHISYSFRTKGHYTYSKHIYRRHWFGNYITVEMYVSCTKKYADNSQKRGRRKQPRNSINKQLKNTYYGKKCSY